MRLVNVTSAIADKLLNMLYEPNHTVKKKKKISFKVGDSVRVSKYKIIFEKGFTPN